MDGRADLYGDDLLRQSIETMGKLQTGWRDVLDTWQVEAVLLPPCSAMAQALLLDPGWHKAFSDSGAILLLRTPPEVENTHISQIRAESPLPAAPTGEKMFPRAIRNLRN